MHKNNQIQVLYLLGAGRSGTTLMATVLNASKKEITSVGEVHQFREHLVGGKHCSCGKSLETCEFWKKIVTKLPKKIEKQLAECEKKEKHKKIPSLFLNMQPDNEYLESQESVFRQISVNSPGNIILDSSKYIARYLLLSRSDRISIKGIYVVRDIRGVINSFKKKVQTSKPPIATIVYYFLINFFGQLVCWLDSRVIKVKYEDFIEEPTSQLLRIQHHVFWVEDKKLTLPEEMEIPHIIGGNRIKHNKKISISPDYKWKKLLSRRKQILYYLAVWPFMMINRYKI